MDGQAIPAPLIPDPAATDTVVDSPAVEHQSASDLDLCDLGVDPAIIYAYEKTGRLITEENHHLLSDADLAEWNDAIEEHERKHRKPPKYPLGTVALYGPDDKVTTKIAAGVLHHPGAEPIIERWVGTDVTANPKVQREIKAFFEQHGVQSVTMTEGNMGCPHEEGPDFPVGEDCPFCPFWKGKQGSNQRE